jgi:predicted ATP-dependent serine protease
VFVNAVGGVRISEPAADLAVLLAITGSLRAKPLPKGFIAFGEVGLAGEVRPAPRGQERLREAAKLGFSVAVVPKANAPRKADRALEASRSTPSSAWTRPSRWCVNWIEPHARIDIEQPAVQSMRLVPNDLTR